MRAAKRCGAGRSPSTRAQSRTARPAAGRSPACQNASVISRSTDGVARVGVARVDQAPRGERVVALGERVLGGGHEALHALGARVGRAEVDELERVGGHGAHAGLEAHARPLLDVVAAAGEVDAGDLADAPLGVGEAARVAVHDRVVGDLRAERVVLRAIGLGGAPALLLLVGAAALLLARLAGRGGADLDRVAA